MIMTREDIENAGHIEREKIIKKLQDGYHHHHHDINFYTVASATIDQYALPLFVAGANWRIKSVWHDANEMPDLGEAIIVELFGKVWDYGTYNVSDSIHPKAKWAYMNDLIPSKED